jgi:hypothetical protein
MSSVLFKSIVSPILNTEFDGVYDQRDDEWKGPFKEITGTPRSYHEEPVLYGMGAAPELPDGAPVTYQSGGQLFVKRYQYKVYGLAFALTQVLVEDGDHIRIGQIYSRHLAQSLVETKETLCANIFNRSFNASYAGGDGVSLISTSHPLANGGTWSNQLPSAAALSQTSVEQMLIQIRQAVDANGKKINLKPRALVTAPANELQAEVIMNSALRTGNANNDINPIKSKNLLPQGQFTLSRLTSPTAWWIVTEVQEGLKLVNRRGLKRSMEGDFETDSMKYKCTERYQPGYTDARAAFGTSGL